MTLTPGLFDRNEAIEILRAFGVPGPETELDLAAEMPKLADELPVYGIRARRLLLVARIPSTSGNLYTIRLAPDDKRYYDPRCDLEMSHTIRICGFHCGCYTERQWFAEDALKET